MKRRRSTVVVFCETCRQSTRVKVKHLGTVRLCPHCGSMVAVEWWPVVQAYVVPLPPPPVCTSCEPPPLPEDFQVIISGVTFPKAPTALQRLLAAADRRLMVAMANAISAGWTMAFVFLAIITMIVVGELSLVRSAATVSIEAFFCWVGWYATIGLAGAWTRRRDRRKEEEFWLPRRDNLVR